MEIRKALKKIDNYLSVVQNLNKTILEEGTMAPDELKLMKKYLNGCIERIEGIELKLNIADPAPDEMTETPLSVEKEAETDTILPPVAFIEEDIKPEMTTEVIVEETILAMQTEQIIIDPEQTRNEIATEPEMVALAVEETVQVTEETVMEPEPGITEIISETTTTTTFQLIGTEASGEQAIGSDVKHTWADLWEDEKEPVNNGLVLDEAETIVHITMTEAPESVVVERNEYRSEEIRQPLVVMQEEEEEVVHTIVAFKEETTLNDVIQTKKETGLFEMFHAAEQETAPLKSYTSETQVQDVAETDVMVAELESKQPEFTLSRIFDQVKTGSEERIKAAKTLSESIALNDKFIFVRELFGNQFNEYENALRALDNMGSFEEAEKYCRQHLQEKFKWTDRPANTEKFYALLDKRFNS